MQKANKQVAQICKTPQNDQYLEHKLIQVVQREDLSRESLQGGGAAGRSGVQQGESEEETIGTQTRLSSTIMYGQFSRRGKLPTTAGNVPDLRTGQGDGEGHERPHIGSPGQEQPHQVQPARVLAREVYNNQPIGVPGETD